MPRRAPPPDFYEEEEDDIYSVELDRSYDRDPRRRRRERIAEDDIDYYGPRRRSEMPVEELERLRIRERPPRDFMKEGFSPHREQRSPIVVRGSREEADEDISPRRAVPLGREREEPYPRPRRRRRSGEVDGEEFIVEERDRRDDRGRPFDREFEEDDLIVRRRERDPRYDDHREELVFEERDRRRGRGRRPGDDLVFRRKDRGPPHDYDNDKRDERRDRSRYSDRDVEDDSVIRGKDRGRPREYHSEEELRPRRKPDDDREEIHFHSSTSRRRPRPRELEEEFVVFDDADHARGGARRYRDEPGFEEDVIFRKTERLPSRRNPRFEDDQFQPVVVRDDEPEDDGLRIRMRHRSGARREQVEDGNEEVIVHTGSGRRREGSDSDGVHIRRTRERSVSPGRSLSPEPIRAPPIHQDVFTHHRHIDHGVEAAPSLRAPRPHFRSSNDFEEVDIHHRDHRNGRLSDEDIVLRWRDHDSRSPRRRMSEYQSSAKSEHSLPSRKPRSLDGESEPLAIENVRSHRTGTKSVRDKEEEIEMLSTRTQNRSTVPETARDTTDEWSVVHTPSQNDLVEMTGAIEVQEVKSQAASNDAVERSGRAGPQVRDIKDRRDDRWTEVTKSLVVREAIERLGYEYEETRLFYYIFAYLKPSDIDELADLSEDIRRARRRRIHEIQRERASAPPPPAPPLDRPPPRPRMLQQKRIKEREWILDARR